jgi:hypothetical protein
MKTARVTTKWIGATRNRSSRLRLLDVFVDGRRITDMPCTRREVPAIVREWHRLVREWHRHTAAGVTLQRNAHGDYRGRTSDGHVLFIDRIVVPKNEREKARLVGVRMARVLWEPRFDGRIGDVQASARAAAQYLSECWEKAAP